ncbi:hypothetical protein DIPPA_08139 [Diplonema papillatum]|nr:hypothetical protein DIPPA_08139 [Diplonema papillatum]
MLYAWPPSARPAGSAVVETRHMEAGTSSKSMSSHPSWQTTCRWLPLGFWRCNVPPLQRGDQPETLSPLSRERSREDVDGRPPTGVLLIGLRRRSEPPPPGARPSRASVSFRPTPPPLVALRRWSLLALYAVLRLGAATGRGRGSVGHRSDEARVTGTGRETAAGRVVDFIEAHIARWSPTSCSITSSG